MSRYTLAYLSGFASAVFVGNIIGRYQKARLLKKLANSATRMNLTADLIMWLDEAAEKGYTAEQIQSYYDMQKRFINIVTE